MMNRYRFSFTSLIPALVVGIVVGFGGFGFAVSSHPVAGQQNIFDSESQALRDLYARVNPSVVNIVVRIPGGNAIAQQSAGAYSYAAGTGFVYDGSNHIVTNAHVIEGADQIELTLSDGTMMYAKLVGADPDSDIAVVTASSDISKYTPLTLADSDSLQIGDRAVAIGNPFENSGTMTQGIVSGLHRTVLGLNQNYTIPDAIQTDAAINPGNSGGPLLNAQAQVIGINEQIASQVSQSSGVSFAIPSNLVKAMADQLIKNGSVQHSYLGIGGVSTSLETNNAMSVPPNTHGALITTVQPNSPAEKAGLQGGSQTIDVQGNGEPVGGDIITAIDGHPITRFDDLTAYLFTKTSPNQTIVLTIQRAGKEQTVKVTLGSRPAAVPQTTP